MFLPIFSLVVTLATGTTASAEKIALLLGGAQQPATSDAGRVNYNPFIIAAATSIKANHYDLGFAFGGSSETDSKEDFTAKNANALVDALAEKIKKGGPKDQVIIVIEDHGADPSYRGLHKVLTSDGQLYDLAALQKLQKAAAKSGVKLAILDFTCYSGQTIKLADQDPKTCIIAGGSAENVTDSEFGAHFFKNMKPGKSLEDAFLETRKTTSFGYPEISTPNGRLSSDFLKLVNGNFSMYATEALTNTCPFGNSIPNQVSRLSAVLRVQSPDTADLQKQLQLYDDAANKLAANNQFLKKLVQIDTVTVTMQDLVDVDRHLELLQAKLMMASSLSKQEYAETANQFGLIPKMIEKQQELLRTNPEFQRAAARDQDNNRFDYGTFWKQAKAVAKSERSVYQKVYDQTEKTSANPCRDFKF